MKEIIIRAPDNDRDAMFVGLTVAKRIISENWHQDGPRARPRSDRISGQPYTTIANTSEGGFVVVVERSN